MYFKAFVNYYQSRQKSMTYNFNTNSSFKNCECFPSFIWGMFVMFFMCASTILYTKFTIKIVRRKKDETSLKVENNILSEGDCRFQKKNKNKIVINKQILTNCQSNATENMKKQVIQPTQNWRVKKQPKLNLFNTRVEHFNSAENLEFPTVNTSNVNMLKNAVASQNSDKNSFISTKGKYATNEEIQAHHIENAEKKDECKILKFASNFDFKKEVMRQSLAKDKETLKIFNNCIGVQFNDLIAMFHGEWIFHPVYIDYHNPNASGKDINNVYTNTYKGKYSNKIIGVRLRDKDFCLSNENGTKPIMNITSNAIVTEFVDIGGFGYNCTQGNLVLLD